VACYTGKKVTWEEALSSAHTWGPEECSFDTEPPVKPNEEGVYPVPIPGITRLG
jgi:hypothetical protein